MLIEIEAIAETKAIMAGPGTIGERQEAVRRYWIEWSTLRVKTAPKVDSDTGEIIPPREYRCADCDKLMERPEGHRGRMPSKCEECRATEVVEGPKEHFCISCETQLFRPGGIATGRGRWPTLCASCKGSTDETVDNVNVGV